MIAFCSTLKQLRDECDKWIDFLGEDTLIGTRREPDNRDSTDMLISISLEWIMVREPQGEPADMVFVGDEANDYKLKPGEINAVRIN